jgi:hypothetical protein
MMLRPWSKAGAVIETDRVHGQHADTGQDEDGQHQRAIETPEHRGQALQQVGFFDHGGHRARLSPVRHAALA